MLCSEVAERGEAGKKTQYHPCQRLQDAAGARTCFVDTSVYSRNRAFRLYLSTKASKKAILLPTGGIFDQA